MPDFSRVPPPPETIIRSTPLGKILSRFPHAQALLAEYGLHCATCAVKNVDTIEDATCLHGFSEEKTGDLIADLNLLLDESRLAPVPHITTEAVHTLKKIAQKEGEKRDVVLVKMGEGGNFYGEFCDAAPSDSVLMSSAEESLRVVMLPETLARLSGATITVRGGRFVLEIPPLSSHACACQKRGGDERCNKQEYTRGSGATPCNP